MINQAKTICCVDHKPSPPVEGELDVAAMICLILKPLAAVAKSFAMQMVDVRLPTTDDRYLILPRYTQPNKDLKLLLAQLDLLLPTQPPPQIVALTTIRKHVM
jgi:hypothetical protein